MSDTEMRPPSPPPRFYAAPSKPPPATPPPAPEAASRTGPAPAPTLESRTGGCDMLPPNPPPNIVDSPVIVPPPPPTAPAAPPAGERAAALSLGLLSIVGWGCALVTVMWVALVSAPFLSSALVLHGWRLAAALALASLPLAFAAGLLGFVLWHFHRVPDIPQVREADFPVPAPLRDRLRSTYLDAFPEPDRYADDNGFADAGNRETRTLLVAALNRLQGNIPGRYADSSGWIDDFKQFQSYQNARAAELVRSAAVLVGVKTAASPWKIVDMLAVLYQSSMLIVRLARLYNRRIAPRQAFRLSCRWLVNLYIAGTAGDAAQYVVDCGTASEWISAAWGPAAKFLGKVAEGSANAFLVWRLGTHAIATFQPLVPLSPRKHS